MTDIAQLLAELDAKVEGARGLPTHIERIRAYTYLCHDLPDILTALREGIAQAIKTQQHMDETLRPLVEELRKAAHQARARETEACAEAARLRTECDEQATIASNAVTKGAAYALENERLRAERDQLSEIIDTWGFCWMEEREAWQREREQEAVQLTVGGGLTVRGTMEAISRAQSLLLLNSAHPQEREDVRRSLARALEKVEQENERLRALMRELCDNEDGSGRLSHQIGVPCGLCTAHARINAALAQEVPRE